MTKTDIDVSRSGRGA